MALQQLTVFNHDWKEGWTFRTFPSSIILYSHSVLCPSICTFILFPNEEMWGSWECRLSALPGSPASGTDPSGRTQLPSGHLHVAAGVTALQDPNLDLTYRPTRPPRSREGARGKSITVVKRGSKETLKTTDWLFPLVRSIACDGARIKTRAGAGKGAAGSVRVWHSPSAGVLWPSPHDCW